MIQMKKFRTVTVLLLGATLLLAKNPKIATDFNGVNGSNTVNVIVQFKTPPSKDDLKLLGAYGQMKKQFHGINAVMLPLQVSKLEAIAANPNIVFISPDRK